MPDYFYELRTNIGGGKRLFYQNLDNAKTALEIQYNEIKSRVFVEMAEDGQSFTFETGGWDSTFVKWDIAKCPFEDGDSKDTVKAKLDSQKELARKAAVVHAHHILTRIVQREIPLTTPVMFWRADQRGTACRHVCLHPKYKVGCGNCEFCSLMKKALSPLDFEQLDELISRITPKDATQAVAALDEPQVGESPRATTSRSIDEDCYGGGGRIGRHKEE